MATKEEAAAAARTRVAEMGLAETMSSGTKAILVQAKAWLANPVGAIAATVAILWLLNSAYEALTTSVEEHQQMLEDAKSSYNDTASEIKNLNSQLTDTQNKISELEGYDKLSFTDQQELDRLRIQNDELQRELDLQNQLKDAKQQEVNNEFADTMKADVGKSGEYRSAFEEEADEWGVSSGKSINEMQYAKEQVALYRTSIENYKKYQAELDKAKVDGNKKAEVEAQKQVQIYKKQSEDASKYLNQRISDLTNVAKNVTEDEYTKPYLDFINNLRDSWAIAFNGMSGDTDAWAQSQIDAFNRISNEDEFSSLVSDAKNLGSSLDLTQEKYKDFLQALIDSGFISDTSSDSLKKVADAINDIGESASNATTYVTPLASIPDIYDSIKDKARLVSEAQADMNESGVVSVSTMADLIEKGLLTEDAFIKTANGYKISKSALDSLNGSVIQSYQVDFNNALTAANDVYGAELTKQDGYDGTTESIIRQLKAKAALLEADLDSRHPIYNESAKKYLEIYRAINNLTNAQENLNKATNLYHSISREESSKSKHTSKKETELYIADIDKLYDSKEKLAKIQHEIVRLKSTNDLADDNKQKIKNLNQIIVLYEQEKDALRELNRERRAEISSNVDTLRGQGFDILYDPEANRLIIKNMEHINDLKGKDIKQTNELRKSTESLIDSTQKLNEKNIQGTQTWYSALRSIEDKYRDLQSVVSNTVNKVFDKVSDMLNKEKKAYETQKSNLETVANTVTSYINTYIESLQEENDELDKQISLQEKLEALDKARAQRNKRVYKSGEGFVWSSDSSAVNNAQKEYNSELRQNSIDKKIEDLRDYADAWENAVDSYDRSANRALTKSILGKHWRSDVLGMNYRSIRNFKNEYTDVLSELDSNVYGSVAYQIQNLEDLQDEWKDSVDRASDTSTDYESVLDFISTYEDSNYKTRLSDLSEFVSDAVSEYNRLARAAEAASNISYVDYDSGSGRSSHGKSYDSGKDYSKAIQNAKTRDEVEELAHKRDNKIKGDHISGVDSTDSFVKDWESKHSYANGGVVDYTGPAMVHGGQEHEVVFNGNTADKLWAWVQNTDLLSQSAANMLMANSLPVGSNIVPNSNQSQSLTIGDINVYGANNVDELVSAIKTEFPSKMMQSFYKRK